MKKNTIILLLLMCASIISCSSRSPIERLKQDLNHYPEYTIILQDMRQEGNFFPEYYHQYKIVYAEKKAGADEEPVYQTNITDWKTVDKKIFLNYSNFLGMAVASKTPDGGTTNSQYPPGYQYVNNPRYGQWRTNSSGNSFWEFYGKYAMLSTVFGMFHRPIYRSHWNDYSRYRTAGRPYYGPNREYGTSGSRTKQTNKSFFQRRQQRDLAKKSRFSDRLRSRVRRSGMSGFRSRSSGFGK